MDFINVLEAVNNFITWGWGAVSLPLTVMVWMHLVGDVFSMRFYGHMEEDEAVEVPEFDGVEAWEAIEAGLVRVTEVGASTEHWYGDALYVDEQFVLIDNEDEYHDCRNQRLGDVTVFRSTAAADCRNFDSADLGIDWAASADQYENEDYRLVRPGVFLGNEDWSWTEWDQMYDAERAAALWFIWGQNSSDLRERTNEMVQAMIDHVYDAGKAQRIKAEATKARSQMILGLLEDNRPWDQDEAHIVVEEIIPDHEYKIVHLEIEGRHYVKREGESKVLLIPTEEELS